MTETLTIRWRRRLGVVLLCLNGILSSSAPAQQLPFSELTALLHQVAVYGDHDHRLNEADFAASVGESKRTIRERFAATGYFDCGEGPASAQVTVRNDIITTAAHTLYRRDSCVPKGPVEKCVFSYTKNDGTPRHVLIRKLLGVGYWCPGTPDQKPAQKLDWAVLRLESAADGVTPYQVEAFPAKGLKNGSSVVLGSELINFSV
jgi:hypothetical protein